ncbi:uncharacterized protein Dana_GF20068 [Drosophila ananassae]|uniref:Transcription elongation factor 1 homolog n=1 Tax=Drosophila ananassae TaxID=7217 RepID=B3M9W3_DROAN|nr:transcription elongation factor 1 homolog [Drosophila ananassae]XP_032310000.1 transcription elongation factor 1 homolog [Drosophila ananassae]EDV40154.1 uncharacterized protein Dana_GF20068 [Drosophila ananassae]KAH8312946.1 hypothetical protein KR067_003396 [Drosophila pandora]
MGRRKSKRKAPPKQKNIQPLAQVFDCPFCNHKQACEVLMDKIKLIGRIKCNICQELFQTSVNFLSEPIDVFNDWIDACEEQN